jgi:hypothetical protein
MWYEDVVRISIGHDNTQSFMGHLLGSSNGGWVRVAGSSLAHLFNFRGRGKLEMWRDFCVQCFLNGSLM